MSTIPGLTSLDYNSLSINTAANPVLKTSIPGLAQTAVSLSTQNDIVATLGGAPSIPVTYNAVGLLNTIVQAGTSTQPALTTGKGSSAQSTVQALFNQVIVGTLSTTA